jgi:hypothetical protein
VANAARGVKLSSAGPLSAVALPTTGDVLLTSMALARERESMVREGDVAILLSIFDVQLLVEGLDAYEYWQLGDVRRVTTASSSSPETSTRMPTRTGARIPSPPTPSSKRSPPSTCAAGSPNG